MGRRRSGLLGFFAFAIVIGAASVAWACTEQAFLASGPSSDVAVGSMVKVTGANFTAGPVSIHWDTVTGPLLATTTGPGVDVDVRVPNAEPGSSHHIVAVSDTGHHAAMTVTVEGSAPGPAADVQAATTGADDAAGETPVAAAPAEAAPAIAAVAPATAAPAQRSRAGAPRPASQAGANAQAPAQATDEPKAPGAAEAAPPTASTPPSAASVSADLWSGLTSGTPRRAGPSLIGEIPVQERRGDPFTAGAALAAVGLGMMMMVTAGWVVVGRSRQRAKAERGR